MASDSVEHWFSSVEDAPQGSCTFVTNYPGFGHCPPNVTCHRKTEGTADRCVWHAESGEKTVESLREHRADVAERLDGVTLRNVQIGDEISFEDCILFGSDLSGSNFTSGDLSGADVRYAAVANADFEGADLSGTTFRDASLSGSNLRDARVQEASFRDADLSEANLGDADLLGANFRNADLSLAKIQRANLSGTVLRDANLSEANLWKADLSRAELLGADLSQTLLQDVDLSGAVLTWVDLSESSLRNADLSNANLRGANLSRLDLRGVDLPDANLRGADLSGANLQDVDLSGADLRNADLSDANLQLADLSSADLRQADLSRGNLQEVTLSGADLRNADLSRVDLRSAVFRDADLRQTSFQRAIMSFTDEGWKSTRINTATTFGRSIAEQRGDFGKAAREYRIFQQTLRENGLPRKVTRYRIREKHMRRKAAFPNHPFRWLILAGQRWTTLYGESPWRVVSTSFTVIGIAALLYPRWGLLNTKDGARLEVISFANMGTADQLYVYGKSLYFSVVTFTTVGYGDLQPLGYSEALATIESFVGALLMALLVFVLGRRTTW